MQTIEFKKGDPSNTKNFASAINRFIGSGYQRDASDFESDLRRLEEMRGEAMGPMVTPSFLLKLKRYYNELEQLAAKFPFDDDNLKVTFAWSNFAGKDTKPVASFDIRFEEASILFNMAVLNGKLGNLEGRGSPDKLRKACNYFLTAAGLLQFIMDKYGDLSLPVGADLREPVLMALKQLLVAQAQECFILKGIQDKSIRDGMLSKLASSASRLYEEAYELSNREKGLFGPSWLYHCQVKSCYFKALANSRKAAECLANGQYGIEVAFLQVADGAVREAKSLLDTANKASKDSSKHLAPELTADIVALMAQNSKQLERSRKDNDIIYHETIPGADSLPEIGAAIVANPIAFDATTSDDHHLFESLSPYSLHRVVFSFLQKRDQTVNELSGMLASKKHQLESALLGMNLPTALDAREAPQGLPQSILEKSEDVKTQGGSESLYSSKKTVQSLRGECLEVVEAIEKLLWEESDEDAAMATRFKTEWKRQPSSELVGPFKERLATLQKTLDAAGESDELVSSRFEEYIVSILSLCSDREDLEASIPACRAENMPPVNHQAINELRGLLEAGNQLNVRGAELTNEIKATAETMLNPASFSGSASSLNEVETESALARFDPFRTACIELVGQYDTHMTALRTAFDAFSDRSHLEASMQERTEALRSLEEAHAHFSTLSSNFFEGIQFYTRCLESLQLLQGDFSGWREGRRFEGEEMRMALMAVEEEQVREARREAAELAEREAKEKAEKEALVLAEAEKARAASSTAAASASPYGQNQQPTAAGGYNPNPGYPPYSGYSNTPYNPQQHQPAGPYTPQPYQQQSVAGSYSSPQFNNQPADYSRPHQQPQPSGYSSGQPGASYQQPSLSGQAAAQPNQQSQAQQGGYSSSSYQQPPVTSQAATQQPSSQSGQPGYSQQYGKPATGPSYGQPSYGGQAQQPSYGQPQQPSYQQSSYGQPSYSSYGQQPATPQSPAAPSQAPSSQPSYGQGPAAPTQSQNPSSQPQTGYGQGPAYGQPAYLQQLGYGQPPQPQQQQQSSPPTYGSSTGQTYPTGQPPRPGQWNPSTPVQYASSPAGYPPYPQTQGGAPQQQQKQPPQGSPSYYQQNPNYRPPPPSY